LLLGCWALKMSWKNHRQNSIGTDKGERKVYYVSLFKFVN